MVSARPNNVFPSLPGLHFETLPLRPSLKVCLYRGKLQKVPMHFLVRLFLFFFIFYFSSFALSFGWGFLFVDCMHQLACCCVLVLTVDKVCTVDLDDLLHLGEGIFSNNGSIDFDFSSS